MASFATIHEGKGNKDSYKLLRDKVSHEANTWSWANKAKTKLIHHAFPDPYFASGDFEARLAAFRKVRDQIADYIGEDFQKALESGK